MTTLKFWLPAMAGMACLGLGAGLIGVYGFFVEPLSQEFGVGVATINVGPAALLLVPGIVAPFVGRLADRVPIRRLVIVGITLAMCALLVISATSTLLLAGVCFLMFSLGLTFYGPVVVNGLMVKLYAGREARALSIAAIGISVASMTLPPFVGLLLSYVDWRTALAILAGGVWLLLVGICLATLPAGVVGHVTTQERDASGTFQRGREFWLIGFCVAIGLCVSIVLALVYPPHFVSEGYTLQQAGWFLAFAGLSGLLGKAGIAWLGDRGKQHAKWLAIGLLFAQLAGLVLLLLANSAGQVLCALFFLGSGGGGFIPMHPYLNSRYFDAGVISAVIGAQMPLFVPFGLVGAPLAGYVYDRTGSYELVFTGLIVMLSLAAFLALRLPRPAGPK